MSVFFSLLMILVILVNGWTDASGAIATCISTHSLSPTKALMLAAVCNLIGSLWATLTRSRVAYTVYRLADFGDRPEIAFPALCASLCAVVIWAVLAWWFGLPTSESHALLAGLSGASVACHMGTDGINLASWGSVLIGLFLSTLPVFLLSRLFLSLLHSLCQDFDRRRTMRAFRRAQIWSAGCNALMHGAQDSQKFMGVLMLGIALANQRPTTDAFYLPMWTVLLCGGVMALGTAMGGGRIVKKLSMDMVRLDAAEGTAADMASSALLSICTFCGLPVSTTHVKTCAMMGVGASGRNGIDPRVAIQMLLAWLITFPVCGAIGFLLTYLMIY